MSPKLLSLIFATLPLAGIAQISYTGGIYMQDFNSLSSGAIYTLYTNLPAGWIVTTAVNADTYVWTPVTNGFSNNYGEYCFSLTASDPDKAIGLVIGSTGQAYLGARFRNATGMTLSSFSLDYFAEQWRKGAIASNDQVIPFAYSLNATSLASGTFVNVPALDMHSINDGDGVAAAMNGNANSNRQLISGTVSGLSWLPNQDLWIRWSGVSYSFFSAHALAIDDLTFRAVPALQVSSIDPAHFRISWPTNYPGYGLQSASDPMQGSWGSVTNPTVIVGNEFSVQLETTEPQRFFRLKLQ